MIYEILTQTPFCGRRKGTFHQGSEDFSTRLESRSTSNLGTKRKRKRKQDLRSEI
jgi:hypothetical protein